jgi:hypothetical protein
MLEMRCGAMWKEDEIGWLINHVGSIIFSTINREDGFSRLIHMMKKNTPKKCVIDHLSPIDSELAPQVCRDHEKSW